MITVFISSQIKKMIIRKWRRRFGSKWGPIAVLSHSTEEQTHCTYSTIIVYQFILCRRSNLPLHILNNLRNNLQNVANTWPNFESNLLEQPVRATFVPCFFNSLDGEHLDFKFTKAGIIVECRQFSIHTASCRQRSVHTASCRCWITAGWYLPLDDFVT